MAPPAAVKTGWFAGLLGIALLVTSAAYFRHLDWGTPSREKHLQMFADDAELSRYVPRMLELRNKYYSGIGDMLNPEKPFKQSFDDLFYSFKKNDALAELTPDQTLDRMRGYLIGVVNSDEQNTVQAIGRLNPFKLKFNPGLNTFYGGFYYYVCGGALFAAKALGQVELVPDLQYYFYHPDQTRRMYAIVRMVGVLSVLFSAGLIVLWMRRLYGLGFALLAALFFLWIPLLIPYSHMAKAHALGMFLLFAGAWFLWRTWDDPSWKNYGAGTVLLGLSAGSIITNLSVGLVIFVMEWARNHWRLAPVFKNIRFWICCLLFFAVYAATNFYVIAHYDQFQRNVLSLQEFTKGYGNTYGELRLSAWPPFLIDMFTNQIHWSVIPLLAAGFWAAVARRDKLLISILLCLAGLTAANLLSTRHPGVNVRALPFIALFCASGVLYLWDSFPKLKILTAGYAAAALFLSGAQTFFFLSMLREPSHLTLAGDWVNANVARGDSIGAVGGQFYQAGFPAIRFLEYKLVQFPNADEAGALDLKNLPDYVIWTESKHPVLDAYYKEAARWDRPSKFLGIPFHNNLVASGSDNLRIFKKTDRR